MTDPASDPRPPSCPETPNELAERLVERLLAIRRERRRRFWRQCAYVLSLLGALSGLVTLLVTVWEKWF